MTEQIKSKKTDIKLTELEFGTISKLHQWDIKSYSIYTRSDNRLVIYFHTTDGYKNRSYPKMLLECKLNRVLTFDETCDHIDDNPLNNDYNNLQVLSRRDNAIKGYKTGTYDTKKFIAYSQSERGRKEHSERIKGSKNPNSKLSQEQVANLRHSFTKGEMNVKQIASEYNMSQRAVKNMLTGISYSHITPYAKLNKRPQITDEVMKEVKLMLNSGDSIRSIASHFGIHHSSISYRLKKDV